MMEKNHLFVYPLTPMRKIFIFIICLLGLPAFHVTYLYTHREFAMADFCYPFVLEREGRADLAAQELTSEILEQPFHYLGQGQQMSAFESQDHRYVIKFFNPRRVMHSERCFHWTYVPNLFGIRWFSRGYFKGKKRLEREFDCYQMAFEGFREEAGLVYVHVNSSTAIDHILQVTDKNGIVHEIDLAKTPFVLQEKAELSEEVFKTLLTQGEEEKLRHRVLQMRHLFETRAKKGFSDQGVIFPDNYGFLADRAVQIDLGKIRKNSTSQEALDAEFVRVSKSFKNFVAKMVPNFLEESLSD